MGFEIDDLGSFLQGRSSCRNVEPCAILHVYRVWCKGAAEKVEINQVLYIDDRLVKSANLS
ncbi:hypothetical protein SASPL_111764 [Salvia splendens]|uniref:Uncharacterized protein n=1 Tax=Salvia splendens TaxID=180675 RepID=A0A8X8YD57_SALSN|nr:hypothetical protein SASPL_111764 [Salvia splendens]